MKKFITIALAVAVLFSFAACQEPIDVNGYVPTGLSIQYNGEDILAGEAFDATQYSATITYKNGKPGEYAGQFALMDNQSPAQATDKYAIGVYVTASVQGETAPIDAVYTPTVYAVEKVVADVSGATVKEVAVGSTSVGLDGVTVTAYYDNGKTKDVTALATATVTDGTTSAAKDKAVGFAQVLGTTVTVEGEWKVNVVAKTLDTSKIVSYTLTPAKTLYAGATAANTDWKVVATDENGNSDEVTTGFTIVYTEGVTGSTTVTYEYGKTVKAYAKETSGDAVSNLATAPVDDCVKSVQIVDKDKTAVTTEAITYSTLSSTPLDALKAGGYQLEITMAGNTAKTYDTAFNNVTFSVPALKNGTDEVVTFTYKAAEGAPTVSVNPSTGIKFTYQAN